MDPRCAGQQEQLSPNPGQLERTENQQEKFILQLSKPLLFSLPRSSRAREGAAQLSAAQKTTRKGREDRDGLGREDEEQAGISPWAKSRMTGIEGK